MKKHLFRILDSLGYQVFKYDYPRGFNIIYDVCKPYTCSPKARMFAIYNSIKYILDNNIEGDVVECGVWKGGSAMLMGMAMRETARMMWLYDTFSGMPEPGTFDTRIGDGTSEAEGYKAASFEEVKANLDHIGYNWYIPVIGKVEETIPLHIPERISFLRLDTDYYSSTKHELEHLYPRLQPGGVLMIDDYGSWQGARKAVDEFFGKRPMMFHIDKQSVAIIKP